MIISASYRTDIPALYGRWFLARLAAGFCDVVNPYGGAPVRVALAPEAVDGYVFWTRNLAAFEAGLAAVHAQALPFVVQFTVIGYPRALERSTIAVDTALAQMIRTREVYGPRAVVWRYDPLVVSSLTPVSWHEAQFARLSAALAGVVDEVVISFLQPYRKTARNMALAAKAGGFTWRLPEPAEKVAVVERLALIAAEHGQRLTLCTQPELFEVGGAGTGAGAGVDAFASAARCIDADRLAAVAGRPLVARTKGNRPGCFCAASRDIGAYDTCSQGCAYCYAVASPQAVRERRRRHGAEASFLVPPSPIKRGGSGAGQAPDQGAFGGRKPPENGLHK